MQAARGVSEGRLTALLTYGNASVLQWPFIVGGVSLATHLSFYVALLIIALVAAIATTLAARSASAKGAGAAFFGTWFGVVAGAAIAGVALYYWRVGALVPNHAGRNAFFAGTLRSMTYAGLIVGWIPGLLLLGRLQARQPQGRGRVRRGVAAGRT